MTFRCTTATSASLSAGFSRERVKGGRRSSSSSANWPRGSSILSRGAETIDRFAHQASNRLRENTGWMADELRVQFNGGQVVVRHNTTRSVAVVFGIGLVAGLIVGLAVRHR